MGTTRVKIYLQLSIMKFCILLVLAIIGYVASESCRSANDCNWENCATSAHIACVKNTCTCDHDQTCRMQTDCPSGLCADNRHRYHCIDGKCNCGYITHNDNF